ncbi:ADP-ribosylglycohydrolase family protein [Thalassoroseus pseudoceratinae]|uniref:ADP-ribosylglycohydrolase family protein n=1 Tax=Thalassoroseus pseudoceratinae TaxID=2713176 RepID=UPI00141F6440|nr:ADP-ribosylglycohydrolase family protein [Thalassoroseus pseudoceratinae]
MSTTPRMRARLALDGLSVGDAFGQQFFYPGTLETATRDNLPPSPWNYTDDTEMAISVVQTLEQHGEIDQDSLAERFASRYAVNPYRSYGAGAQQLLRRINDGVSWQHESRAMFGGSGSYGNGAAMRVAPLGAWFADDVDATVRQARLSAEVTHTHAEGIAGAIAVALAAGWTTRRSMDSRKPSGSELLPWILSQLEPSEVRTRLEWASFYALDTWPFTVASQVGCGEQISAQDTVPFCLWMAAAFIDDYSEAMWITARIGGDIDTNCAIIGGIVAMNTGREGIPAEWMSARESLRW